MDSTQDREIKKARSYCLKLLSISARTEGQIASKLEGKGYAPDVSRQLIDELKSGGLLDDERYARDWVEQRQGQNPRSRKMLKAELAAKGVEGKTIDKVLSGVGDERTAFEIAAGKMETEKDKAKVFRFLLGRGFDADTAEEAVRKVLDEDG